MEWIAMKLNGSFYKVEHTSDVLRCAVLWRFGGTYLDADMVVLRQFPEVSKVPNIIAQQRNSQSWDSEIFSRMR